MTPQQASTPPGSGTARDDFDPRRLKDAPMRMHRSRTDRKIAGVCGGFAQYAGIDPVVVRVVVAALTVVGGVGLVLYAAGWLLVPEEGSERAAVDRHHGRDRHEVRRVGWLIAAAVAFVAVLGSGPWFGPGIWWDGWPLWPVLAILALGWFVLTRPDRVAPPDSGPPTDPSAPAAPDSPASFPGPSSPGSSAPGPISPGWSGPDPTSPGWSGPGPAPSGPGSSQTSAAGWSGPGVSSSSYVPPSPAAGPTPPGATPFGSARPGAAPTGAAPTGAAPTGAAPTGAAPTGAPGFGRSGPGAPPTSPPDRRPRRGGGALAALTVALSLVTVGVLWLVEQPSDASDPSPYIAAVLAVIGLGTLVGAWVGNGRWLIPLGVVATLALMVSAVTPVWSTGDYDAAPTRAAALPATYQLGAGRVHLDLTDVRDLDALDGRTLAVDIGAGEITVLLPEGLGVEVDASLLVGDLQVLDRGADGLDNDLQVTDSDPDDPVLRLELVGAAGHIEVTRP